MSALRGAAAAHTRWRITGAAVPPAVIGPGSLPDRSHHHNSLPRSAFDLPADRFGAPVNLIDAVATALRQATGQPHSVVSPVGSLVYARDPELRWDVVHDADIWCYVPRAGLAGPVASAPSRRCPAPCSTSLAAAGSMSARPPDALRHVARCGRSARPHG